MASSLFSGHDQQGNDPDEVRLMHLPQDTFLKKDQLGHVQLSVTAYVDGLVISGSAQKVKEFASVIQEEFTLKHVSFFTSENPVSSLVEK